MKWQIVLAVTTLVSVGGICQGETTIRFDELSFQPVNGLMFSGVHFGYQINGAPSEDAYFGSFGPGGLTYVTDPSLTGNSTGVMSLLFEVPTPAIEFGFALNTASSLSPGLTVELFDNLMQSMGVTSLNTTTTAGGLGFSEGQFVYSGVPASKAVIDFADAPGSFAFDNLVFVVPEPTAISMLILGALGVRSRCRQID